jgi:hypothetical protein
VGRATGLNSDQTRRQLLEERQHLTAPQPAPNNDGTLLIDTMDLEH